MRGSRRGEDLCRRGLRDTVYGGVDCEGGGGGGGGGDRRACEAVYLTQLDVTTDHRVKSVECWPSLEKNSPLLPYQHKLMESFFPSIDRRTTALDEWGWIS
jgi:hypothetical protein